MLTSLQSHTACADCEIGGIGTYGVAFRERWSEVAARRLAVLEVEPRRTILREGESPEKIFAVRRGWACRNNALENGRRQIVSFLVPGDLLLLESLVYPKFRLPFDVKAVTQVTLCQFALPDMAHLVRSSPAQAEHFEACVNRYVNALHRRLGDLGRRSAHGRIAQLLIELEGRLAARGLVANGSFDFPLRQDHIADATGLTTVHVNRVLSQMRKDGLIERAPGQLRIVDRDELARIGAED